MLSAPTASPARAAQQRVLDHCVAGLREPGTALALTGSYASGATDEYSDIDLTLLVLDRDGAGAERRVDRVVREAGRVLAWFPASHLGLDHLFIYFLEVDRTVVKVDVAVCTPENLYLPADARVVHDPSGYLDARLSGPHAEPGPGPDFALLYRRFTGWTWYTYTKIARGELLEAADSLDVMRRVALLPCLQHVEHLPPEGYRRLETRLPPALYASLCDTYPRGTGREELLRALRSQIALFMEFLPRLEGARPPDASGADLPGLLACVPELGEPDVC